MSAPTPTQEMVNDLLTELKAAQSGDAAAAERLNAATADEAVDETPVPQPEQSAWTITEKRIIRPNGEAYVVRKMGPHDDVAVLRTCREKKLPLLMFGLPGNGKTALFEAAFTEDGFEYVPGSGDTEVSDFIGGYVPSPDPAQPFLWVDGPLVRAMVNGVPLLVDEIALVDPKVMAVVYSVMDGRAQLNVTANPERGLVSSAPGFYVAAACNPNAPGARMSEALLSRFLVHAEVTVDFGFVKKMGVPTRAVQAGQNLKKKYDANEVSWYPGIRELLGFKQVAEVFGQAVALSNLAAQAPEIDRVQVTDVLSRAFGVDVQVLKIS